MNDSRILTFCVNGGYIEGTLTERAGLLLYNLRNAHWVQSNILHVFAISSCNLIIYTFPLRFFSLNLKLR